MTNTQPASVKGILNTKVSLITGTLALATAVLVAYSVIPSSEESDTTLLQASVYTILS